MGLGDVYKRQEQLSHYASNYLFGAEFDQFLVRAAQMNMVMAANTCLLYTSDAADERSSVDLGGRRIIKKKNIRLINISSGSIRQFIAHTHK